MAIKKLKTQILYEIEKAFEKAFSKKPEKLELGFPPDVKFGDFAVEFFGEAKNLGRSPAETAKKVEEEFFKPHPLPHRQAGSPLLGKERGLIVEAKAVGPYLNIKIKNEKLFGAVISEIEKEKEKFGNTKAGKGKKVMVEYLSPNTNKPLHLGHARNGSIGMALANILEAQDYEIIKTILINDRGVHISKSMLAWQKWGNGETPESAKMKGDHFVGKYYVKYAKELEKNPELENEVQEMLKKWETGDEETMKVWKLMNEWFYEGFKKTCEEYDFEFDEKFYESETYKLGKDIISKGIEKGVFRKDETGAVVFDLPEGDFGRDKNGELKKQTVLRADGTSVYITQDLGTAAHRFEKYKLEKLIYVVGSEQVFHFKVLFKILESLGYDWAKNLRHFSHGMVTLPEGKMKSREGMVVDADDLLVEVEKLVSVQIKEHDPEISKEELNIRARKIALGAIKFHLLRVRPTQDIEFDPKESVAIDGFTGPYCQYAYARISGILRNAEPLLNPCLAGRQAPLGKGRRKIEIDFSLFGNKEELELIQKLIQFPEIVEKAGEELNPLRIVTLVYEIAQAFNLFYNNHQVLDEKNEKITSARIKLAEATGLVIKNGLNLLGIEVLERM
ncbi:MAG TPA: arginine--tRNA ligase [Candidatus Moranbacteria bacterium]|nr:arginine--tRNA ligase [Candidatus Moranbacteria bacterium]